MKKSIIKIAGRDTLYYEPAAPTKNVVVALHGVGEKTFDDLARTGLGKVAETTEINAHIYLPLWPGAYFPIDGLLVPLETALCSLHGIDGITLGTGLSAGGNVIYQWIASGKAKMKKAVPIATNSSQSNVLGLISQCSSVDIWHFHGEIDSVPNQLSTSEKFIVEYNKKFPFKAKRTVFKAVGHNAWDSVYGSVLSKPTVVGADPLYVPFALSIWDWAFPKVVTPPVEPPVDPPVEPVKDKIVDSYFDGDVIIHICESGKKLVVTPTA